MYKYTLGIITLFVNMTHDNDESFSLSTELKRTNYGAGRRNRFLLRSIGQNFSNFKEYMCHLGCWLNCSLVQRVWEEA